MPINWTKIAVIGDSGTDTDQLNGPLDVAVDDTHMYVADYNNSRILKWTHSGVYVDGITSLRSNAVIVTERYLYVLDITNDVIKKYDKHTLALERSSSAFSNLNGMTWFRDNLYAVDLATASVYKIDPNTLSRLGSWDLTSTITAPNTIYDIAANGNYLYVLASTGYVYRLNSACDPDGPSVDLSSYATSGWDYISAMEDYLFVSSYGEDTFVVIDKACQVIEDVTIDTDDLSTVSHITRMGKHVFIIADFTGDQLVIMYGFDRQTGVASGDDITIDGGWDFGDDLVAAGTAANLSDVTWVETEQANPQSRNSWKEASF